MTIINQKKTPNKKFPQLITMMNIQSQINSHHKKTLFSILVKKTFQNLSEESEVIVLFEGRKQKFHKICTQTKIKINKNQRRCHCIIVPVAGRKKTFCFFTKMSGMTVPLKKC